MSGGLQKIEPLKCDIKFHRNINSDILAKLITELIKHILYMRELLPIPFDELKQELGLENESLRKGVKPQGIAAFTHVQKTRKAKDVLSTLESVLSAVSKVVSRTGVKEIILLFGSTVITPQEKYFIKFPSVGSCSECKENISFRRGMLDIFHSMQKVPSLFDMKPLCSARFSVMMEIRKDELDASIMEPKTSYQPPQRGKEIQFMLNNPSCAHSSSELSTSSLEDSGYISGSQPGAEITDSESEEQYLWVQMRPTLVPLKNDVLRMGRISS